MMFPENKSKVEEVIERRWDLSSHEICHLYVAPDSPCQTPSHSTDPKPHPASLTWKQAAPRRSSAQTFLQRKRETTNSCPTGPPAKFQLKLGISMTSSASELELTSPETEGLPASLQSPWKERRIPGGLAPGLHMQRCVLRSAPEGWVIDQALPCQLASGLGPSPASLLPLQKPFAPAIKRSPN